ncbi:MAG: PepSY domain-containing protein [Sneathiella sp.]
MKFLVSTLFFIIASLSLSNPALADRNPNADEMAALSAQLKSLGYVSWEEIEIDDDDTYWEVDDARKEDGSRWDLKLDEKTLEVIELDRED